jgi:poly(3-hydroxybutyrate) depolymerase
MHAAPPVFNGEAPASGLSAIAAPHNPTPATTFMPNRSVIDVNSPYHGQADARRSTSVQPHRDRDSHGHTIFNKPLSNTHDAAPERFQIETFSRVWRSAEHRKPIKHSNQPKPKPALDF